MRPRRGVEAVPIPNNGTLMLQVHRATKGHRSDGRSTGRMGKFRHGHTAVAWAAGAKASALARGRSGAGAAATGLMQRSIILLFTRLLRRLFPLTS
jgi:hypothetical protein